MNQPKKTEEIMSDINSFQILRWENIIKQIVSEISQQKIKEGIKLDIIMLWDFNRYKISLNYIFIIRCVWNT